MKTYKSIFNKIEKLEEKANALISEFGDEHVYSEDCETLFAVTYECNKEDKTVVITANDFYGASSDSFDLTKEDSFEECKEYLHELNIYLNRGKKNLKYYDVNKEEEDENYSTKFAESEDEDSEEVSEEETNESEEDSDKIVYKDASGVYTKEYFIDKGEKEEYYTLWKETIVDLRPQDGNGNPTNEGREINYNRFGNVMDYFCHYRFIQNLSKTRDGAIKKAKELGLKISDSKFSFELRHKGKPSFEAFGVKMQFKREKWYGKANDSFFLAWRNNKEEMKKIGWSCWKYSNPRTNEIIWYMGIKPNEKVL